MVVVMVVMVVVVTPAGEQGPLGDGVRGDGAENNQRWQHHREECLEYNIRTIFDYCVTKQSRSQPGIQHQCHHCQMNAEYL